MLLVRWLLHSCQLKCLQALKGMFCTNLYIKNICLKHWILFVMHEAYHWLLIESSCSSNQLFWKNERLQDCRPVPPSGMHLWKFCIKQCRNIKEKEWHSLFFVNFKIRRPIFLACGSLPCIFSVQMLGQEEVENQQKDAFQSQQIFLWEYIRFFSCSMQCRFSLLFHFGKLKTARWGLIFH